MAGEVIVICEQSDGKLKVISNEILTKGREISAALGVGLSAVVAGSGIEPLGQELSNWAAKIFVLVRLSNPGWYCAERPHKEGTLSRGLPPDSKADWRPTAQT
jgi:hypothetical protein